jgi:hypothetical protein
MPARRTASAVFDIAAEQNPAAAMPFWRYTHAGIARLPAGKTSGASGSFCGVLSSSNAKPRSSVFLPGHVTFTQSLFERDRTAS